MSVTRLVTPSFIHVVEMFLAKSLIGLTKGVSAATNTVSKQANQLHKETEMIKRLNAPQLSSMKTRCGLQKVSDLLPRLIRQYEIQAELMKQRDHVNEPAVVPLKTSAQQATFSWYE